MTVMRSGDVHLRVGDLEAARRHYATTLGLRVVAEENDKVYLRGWDEFDHHFARPGSASAWLTRPR
jgi:catechol 2,3-dioxygenase